MNSPRVGHSMTQLPNSIVANGQLLVAGGSSTGSDTLSSAELFSGTSTWTATPAMPGPLQGQQAVLLSGNMVLVAGGLSSTSTVQTAAYLYDASFGLGCTTNSQCPSGFCVQRHLLQHRLHRNLRGLQPGGPPRDLHGALERDGLSGVGRSRVTSQRPATAPL